MFVVVLCDQALWWFELGYIWVTYTFVERELYECIRTVRFLVGHMSGEIEGDAVEVCGIRVVAVCVAVRPEFAMTAADLLLEVAVWERSYGGGVIVYLTDAAIVFSDDVRTCDTGLSPACDGVGSVVADRAPNGRGG